MEKLKAKIESYDRIDDIVEELMDSDLAKVESNYGESTRLISEQKEFKVDMPDYEVIGGTPVCWILLAGDCEVGFFAALYLDEDGEIRAYIPEKGNTYDVRTNMAFGQDNYPYRKDGTQFTEEDEDDDDQADALQEAWDSIVPDYAEMKEDVKNYFEKDGEE